MRYYWCLLFFLIGLTQANGQEIADSISAPLIIIKAKRIGADSVILSYNNRYELAPSECEQMIRYGHYNFKTKNFFGKFKDISAADSNKVISEGAYSQTGLKEGDFILNYPSGILEAKGHYTHDKFNGEWTFYYPNGNLRARGNLKMGEYTGKWEWNYEDGRPFLLFDVQHGTNKLLYEWGDDGVALVKDGEGLFKPVNGAKWQGSLNKGVPDGTWTCTVIFGTDTTNTAEFFKGGVFLKGYVRSKKFNRDYNAKSSIILLPYLPDLEIRKYEYLTYNPFCDTSSSHRLVRVMLFGKIYYYKIWTLLLNNSSYSEGH